MVEALIAGERDPEVLADMALTRMRPRIPELRRALVGRFDEHHALMISMHLAHVDHLSAGIDRLDAEADRPARERSSASARAVLAGPRARRAAAG